MHQISSIESKERQNVPVDGFDRPICIDELDAFILRSQFQITIAHLVVEIEILGFEPAFILRTRVIPRSGAGETDLRLDIEKKSYFLKQKTAYEIGKFVNEIERNAA